MRIVTLNTWKNEGDYDRRLALMGEGLAGLDPDVILLQEAFACEGADTALALATRLGLSACCFPARTKRRSHRGCPVPSSSGLAILSRAPVRAQARALVSDPRDGERIAVLAETAGGLRLLNLHLTHLGGDRGRDLRARQLAEALVWAEEEGAGPLVVGGDLNAPLDDPALAALRRRAPQTRDTGATLIAGGGRPFEAIDHLALIDPSGRLTIARTFLALNAPDDTGAFPSDHAAVVADLA